MDKQDLLYIGKISNTFGIKGDLKLSLNQEIKKNNLTDFKLIFIKTLNEQIIPFQIQEYREAKQNLIIHLKDLNNINDVEKFKSREVYFNNLRNTFEIEVQIVDYNVYFNNLEVRVIDYMSNGFYGLIKVELNKNIFWVPLVEKYTSLFDKANHKIILKDIEGLM